MNVNNSVIDTLPRATLRLQLHKQFTFAHAREQLPYFAKLGFSHLYVSPILTARAGSLHGYDVVDHSAVNPELGGENELRALVAQLRKFNMGIIVDIVPNHMAVGGSDNRLWLDVLEWGMESRYADFFDIDWDVPDPALKNRLLAPFLGKPYGEALHDGEIALHFDAATGKFSFHYFEHHFPLAPTTYAQLLEYAVTKKNSVQDDASQPGNEALVEFSRRFDSIHTASKSQRYAHFSASCAQLSAAATHGGIVEKTLRALLQQINSKEKNSVDFLHDLLQRQHYRLASWRNAADEINWRRFFDVIQLAGIRIHAPTAFEIVHATTLRLFAEGLIDGVRVDHIDGLAYPRDYCHRLRSRLKRLESVRPADAAEGPAYFIVEKILGPRERFPRDWQVDGTTGYSFMNEVGGLLHDPRGESELANCWADISGRQDDFDAEMKRARQRVLRDLLPADFSACAYALHKIARSDIDTRDWSLFAIRRALAELLIQFPIYRTYADANGRSAADNEIMRQTVANAMPGCRPSDAALLLHIDAWLGRQAPRQLAARPHRQARLRAIARFQQLSAPLAAKAVEDTAFYRYSKLISRNEVGAAPSQFSISADEFHAELGYRAAHFPGAMLTTATHDHKRGEDLRARLAVLSEVPTLWHDNVRQWREMNQRHKVTPVNSAQEWPQPADEYMLYQMLAGSWPPTLQAFDQIGIQAWGERLAQWLLKALREAKSITSWTEPNLPYESACKYFLAQLLDTHTSAVFIQSLHRFVDSIAVAGALNALTQMLLKFTAPGVPDTYQGGDCWDFSFADPDNRRPIDYAARKAAFENTGDDLHALLQRWRDGHIKQRLLHELLNIRKTFPELLSHGNYRPLLLHGKLAQHGFAFTRNWKQQTLLVFVPRFTSELLDGNTVPMIAAERWFNTSINLPERLATNRWHSLLELNKSSVELNKSVVAQGKKLPLNDLLQELPFAILLTESHT